MSNPISILGVIPYKVLPPNMGGQRAIVLLYRSLVKRVRLKAICLPEEGNETFEMIPFFPSSIAKYCNPFLFIKLKRILKTQGFTHVLFEHPYLAWMLFMVKQFTPCKTIIHAHNIESVRFKTMGKWWWKLLWYYEKWAFHQADKIWFITEEDRQYAIHNYHIAAEKGSVVPYGVELTQLPSLDEIAECKGYVQNTHGIAPNEVILLFNGALDYKPNEDALRYILHEVNPKLEASGLRYKLIICGKGLSPVFQELKAYEKHNIIYAGFVKDIRTYFYACDVFLNPTISGGGIKTKLVEALGAGKKCVSTLHGALGVDVQATGGRLYTVTDADWHAFAQAVLIAADVSIGNDHQEFYRMYYVDQIANKALETLRLI